MGATRMAQRDWLCIVPWTLYCAVPRSGNGSSHGGIAIDTGRFGTENVARLDALPAVGPTRVGGASGFEEGT